MTELMTKEKLSFGLRLSKKKIVGMAILSFSDLLSVVEKNNLEQGEKSKIRNILPEPFDWFNHAGNFVNSIWAGVAGTLIAGAILEHREGTEAKKATRIMWAVGATAALGINLVSETRLGMSLITSNKSDYTPDIIDAVYGIGAGCFGASIPALKEATDSRCGKITF